MNRYIVKVRFWLRAYDSVEFDAENDDDALRRAPVVAADLIGSRAVPEEIDSEERREGLISWVDNLDDDRRDVADSLSFAGDRKLHPEKPGVIPTSSPTEHLGAASHRSHPHRAARRNTSPFHDRRRSARSIRTPAAIGTVAGSMSVSPPIGRTTGAIP